MKATEPLALLAAIITLGGCGPGNSAPGSAPTPAVNVMISDAIEVSGGAGIYTNGDDGVKTQIRFPIVVKRVDPTLYHDVQRIGVGGGVVAILDSYGTKNGGERCADGRETWLRLFSVSQRRLFESVPIESCLDRLTAGDPPVTWQGDGFTINREKFIRHKIVAGHVQREEEPR